MDTDAGVAAPPAVPHESSASQAGAVSAYTAAHAWDGTRVVFRAEDVRAEKPAAGDVLVLALGSRYIRHGRANAPTPRKLPALAAFRRRENDTRPRSTGGAWGFRRGAPGDANAAADVEKAVREIADNVALSERRRGGGKPRPWGVEVERVAVQGELEMDAEAEHVCGEEVLVGRAAERRMLWWAGGGSADGDDYDFVCPMEDGRMNWEAGWSAGIVRAALDALMLCVANQFYGRVHGESREDEEMEVVGSTGGRKRLEQVEARTHVALIVPDAADRADVAEFVDALFRVRELRTGAVFVHHSAASCALGAGLSTCVVVDVGYSSTSIACVEDGCVLGSSRVHMQYGARSILAMFDFLLRMHISKDDLQHINGIGKAATTKSTKVSGSEADSNCKENLAALLVMSRACEQLCNFATDENDTLSVAMVREPVRGRLLRFKCGVGVCAVPAYGLLYPQLFDAVARLQGQPRARAARAAVDRGTYDDCFMGGLFDDLKRTAAVAAASRFGVFANEQYAVEGGALVPHPRDTSLVNAIVWSVKTAVDTTVRMHGDSVRVPETRKRYFNSVLLAGGGTAVGGIAVALERALKRVLEEENIVVNDVTVIDGAKGKGDDELLAAAEVLKKSEQDVLGFDDDGDPASLPWKGGAVIVEADAVKESWVYRDEWESKHVRALRERVPFYW